MAVYRTSLGGANPRNYIQDFFSTLTGCLEGICREGALGTVFLAPPVAPPKDDDGAARYSRLRNVYERDVLLLHKGEPVLAVFLRYQCSAGVKNLPVEDGDDVDYAEAPSYAGTSLKDVQHTLGARLRAAVPASEPAEPPKPAFNEGRWAMVLRTPGCPDPTIFQGSPLDIDGVDRAFTVMVDQLVARINLLTTPQPTKA